MKNKLKKSVFLLSSLMMLSVGVGIVNVANGNAVNVAEAAEDVVSQTITFDANKTQRTSFSSTSQVWKSGDVTFTNDKAKSSTAVGDYSNPVRLYQGSTVTIDANGGSISKLIINSDGTSKYKTALQDSLTGAEYEYSNSGNAYTINFTSSVDSVFFSLTAQARFQSIVVSYEVSNPVDYEYWVRFYNEAGVELDSEGTNGEPVSAIADQVKTGYNFIGWGLKDSTEVFDFTAPITGDVDLYPIFEKVETSTIAEVLADAQEGVNYVVTGEVYAKTAYSGYYIQDETGGINLYGNSSLIVGNTVTVFGSYDLYNGLSELTSVELVEVVSDDTNIDTIATLDITDENVGKYVELKEIELTSSLSDSNTSAANAYATDGVNDYTLRYISEYLLSENDLSEFVSGSIVNVKGALSVYNGQLQILPTYIEFAELSGFEALENTKTQSSLGFAYSAVTEGEGEGTVAVTETIVSKDLGYENGDAVESVEGDNITLTFNKGSNSNAPKYYTTGEGIRTYGGNTFVISSEKNITSIVLTFGTGDGTNSISADVGSFDTDTWTGDAQEVTFTVGGATGHRRIASFEVTYGGSAAQTTYTFSDVRVRFQATISAEEYESLEIEAAGFEITAEGYVGTKEVNCEFAEDEDGNYYIICSIWNIPDYDAVMTAKAFFEVDGERYYAKETSYSVKTIAAAYLEASLYNTLTPEAQGAIKAFNAQYGA